MPRCIVLIRSHELLQEGWRQRTFGPAGPLLDDMVKVGGVRFDETYHPVQVRRRIGVAGPADTYAVRLEADGEDSIERLRRDRPADIVGVFTDPVVSPFPKPYCADPPVGATGDVARRLGVAALRRAGLTGRGVHVAVVDTGIDGSRIPVAGGWAPRPGYAPGSSPPNHGTMVAYDVRIAAPDAQLFDYALLTSRAGTWAAFLSDAIAAFADLVERVNATPGRWVVTNSWGLFDRAGDAPIGSAQNYSRKPDLAGLSHFKGSGIYPVDGGTSAASPVAAGVAAALRQARPADRLAPAQLKGLLQRTARDLGGDGWDYDLGYGVIDAAAAVKALRLQPKARHRQPKARPRAKAIR